ncbi:MAG: two pore domain potassium channel family protein, partial [Candidatus Electrothrix sp. AR5]|nr:two pore domain potassium channel family protein [Candidatus Electrothrix sp. AR5]
KLGQIKLKADKEIHDRNLDFTDLDSIVFSGFIVSKPATIKFASCRNWKINRESQMFGITMEECYIFRLKCLGAYLAMNFLHCQIFEPSFNDTYFHDLSIIQSMLLSPQLDKTEVVNFKYIPLENPRYPHNEKGNYRRFRFSFQSVGNLNEAKKCYYNEKCSEREIFLQELKKNNDIPERTNDISYWIKIASNTLIINLKKNKQQEKKRFRRYLYSSFQYYLWGYGEKPINIIKISAYIIVAFSMLFFLFDLTVDSKTQFNPINSLYFSIVTFTTLGYGDIQPAGVIAKILCGVEALTGALMIGLTIAGFSNKSSY